MPRVHGTEEEVRRGKEWEERTRLLVKERHHIQGRAKLASVNTFDRWIMDGEYDPPPKITGGNPGQMKCNVFRNAPYYRNTGTKVAAILPSSKGREVVVWEYIPKLDERGAHDIQVDDYSEDLNEW